MTSVAKAVADNLKAEDVGPWKAFMRRVNGAVYVAAMAFLIAAAMTLMAPSVRILGYAVVSVSGIYLCFQIAAAVFVLCVTLVSGQSVREWRQRRKLAKESSAKDPA